MRYLVLLLVLLLGACAAQEEVLDPTGLTAQDTARILKQK